MAGTETGSGDVVALLDRAREVEVETRSSAGATHRVVIWVVVVEGTAYVASYRGTRGRWWRELLRAGDGALIVGRRRIPIRPHRVRSAETKQAVSAAFARKYATSRASLAAMRASDVLDTTLRLELA
jgi:hypothetical protein